MNLKWNSRMHIHNINSKDYYLDGKSKERETSVLWHVKHEN
jgi:hypothetical protein